jgi:hypothetical protein
VEKSIGTKQEEYSGWKKANRSERHFGYKNEEATDFAIFSLKVF